MHATCFHRAIVILVYAFIFSVSNTKYHILCSGGDMYFEGGVHCMPSKLCKKMSWLKSPSKRGVM